MWYPCSWGGSRMGEAPPVVSPPSLALTVTSKGKGSRLPRCFPIGCHKNVRFATASSVRPHPVFQQSRVRPGQTRFGSFP